MGKKTRIRVGSIVQIAYNPEDSFTIENRMSCTGEIVKRLETMGSYEWQLRLFQLPEGITEKDIAVDSRELKLLF